MNIIYKQPCCVSGEDCTSPGGYQTDYGVYVCDYKAGKQAGKGARLVCFACGDAENRLQ